MPPKPKKFNEKEERVLNLVSMWVTEVPVEEFCDESLVALITEALNEWGKKTKQARKQTAYYIKVSARAELMKLYVDNKKFFDANLTVLS